MNNYSDGPVMMSESRIFASGRISIFMVDLGCGKLTAKGKNSKKMEPDTI